MSAKGYATAADVAAYLGTVFTADQDAQADTLVEAAEQYVDRMTGQAWLVGASVVEDHFGPLNGSFIWLNHPPILTVTSITRRAGLSDTSPTTLVAGTDYEVQDLATGRLWVAATGDFDRFRVTYTMANTVDADIALATRMLVAHWMRPLLEQVGTGIASYSVGAELSVTYQTAMAERGVPSEVDAILAARRRWVLA